MKSQNGNVRFNRIYHVKKIANPQKLISFIDFNDMMAMVPVDIYFAPDEDDTDEEDEGVCFY